MRTPIPGVTSDMEYDGTIDVAEVTAVLPFIVSEFSPLRLKFSYIVYQHYVYIGRDR